MRTMRKGMGYGLCRVADVGVCYFDVAVDGGWLIAVAFEECVHGVCWGLRVKGVILCDVRIASI